MDWDDVQLFGFAVGVFAVGLLLVLLITSGFVAAGLGDVDLIDSSVGWSTSVDTTAEETAVVKFTYEGNESLNTSVSVTANRSVVRTIEPGEVVDPGDSAGVVVDVERGESARVVLRFGDVVERVVVVRR